MAKKKKNSRPANQPSLLSFWGKNTAQKQSKSKKLEEEGTGSSNGGVFQSTGTSQSKKRRLEVQVETPVDLPISSPQPVSVSDQQPVVTPAEESQSQGMSPLRGKYMNSRRKNGVVIDDIQSSSKREQVAVAVPRESKNHSAASGDEKENASLPEIPANEFSQDGVSPGEENVDDSNQEEEKSFEPAPANNYNPKGLSDYELLRLRNIARNNSRLAALGLITPGLGGNSTNSTRAQKKLKRPAKRPSKSATAAALPKRRSSRLSKTRKTLQNQNEVFSGEMSKEQSGQVDVEETLDVTDQYEVSPLVQYEMEQQRQSTNNNHLPSGPEKTDIDNLQTLTLTPCDYRLAPSQGLSAIYSLNFYQDTPWIVGAGKSGIVALWNCQVERSSDDKNYIDPIFTWKAHSGRWISEAQFLSSDNSKAPKRLVTAANDGTVCLWDLSQVSTTTGIPRMQQQSNKDWHASGIFAMDVLHNSSKIATGSKDKTVAIAPIDGAGFTPTWRSHYHQGKVGAVQFRDNHVLATASDDGCAAIFDDRINDKDASPAAILQNLHQGRPHSVLWDLNSTNGLLTAGLDSVIQQWDVRYLKEDQEPVHAYYGHVPISTKRCKRIHHPVFYTTSMGGRFVLTGGQNSNALSIFQYREHCTTSEGSPASRSSVHSRGTLPRDCCDADVGSIAVNKDLVAATVEGEILMLKPATCSVPSRT